MADLRRLAYFLAVARERNFTRAAERLHVAQPALSRQVRLLEQELGTQLLHRTTHAFELTEAGEYLLERGPDLLESADELWRTVASYGTGERGAVIVAYGTSSSYETAPRLLQAVVQRHPGVTVTTAVRPAGEILAGEREGSIDLGLVRCAPQTPGLERRIVRLEPQGVLMRRDHPLAAAATVALADLADETLLLHPRDANPGHYDAVLGLCREHGLEPRVLLRTLSVDLTQMPACAEAMPQRSFTSGATRPTVGSHELPAPPHPCAPCWPLTARLPSSRSSPRPPPTRRSSPCGRGRSGPSASTWTPSTPARPRSSGTGGSGDHRRELPADQRDVVEIRVQQTAAR